METRIDYIGDGLRTIFDITFTSGYLRKEYVYVFAAGPDGEDSDYTNQLDYTWINDEQIELSTAYPAGSSFYIRRVVPRNVAVNSYTDGSIMSEANLDNSFLQALMILEEVDDGYIVTGDQFIINSILNMSGHRITDLGAPEVPSDATTKEYVDAGGEKAQELEQTKVNRTGDVMSGDLNLPLNFNPAMTHATTAQYVLDRVRERLSLTEDSTLIGDVNYLGSVSDKSNIATVGLINTLIDVTLDNVLRVVGGTMLGDLYLNGSNASYNKAASEGYVDSNSIEEAPLDGAQYIRQNGQWVLLTARPILITNAGELYMAAGEPSAVAGNYTLITPP